MTDKLPPLPEFAAAFTPRWLGDEGGFNATQMHAYALAAVMAERERCAKLCDTTRFTGNRFPITQMEQLRMDIAAAIRQPAAPMEAT